MTEKPFAGGRWTPAKFRGFIVNNLRKTSMKWPPKSDAIAKRYIGPGPNPKTGRLCKLHRCDSCGGEFAKGDVRADHIEPVIDPSTGFVGWDEYVTRMFCEEAGFQVVCKPCHAEKTAEERAVRVHRQREAKRAAAPQCQIF